MIMHSCIQNFHFFLKERVVWRTQSAVVSRTLKMEHSTILEHCRANCINNAIILRSTNAL